MNHDDLHKEPQAYIGSFNEECFSERWIYY